MQRRVAEMEEAARIRVEAVRARRAKVEWKRRLRQAGLEEQTDDAVAQELLKARVRSRVKPSMERRENSY